MVSLVNNIALYSVYIIGIVIFLISISGRPKYGIFLLVPLLPLQNVLNKIQQLPFGKDFNDILLVGILIGCLVYNYLHQRNLRIKSPLTYFFILYIIFTYFSLWRGSIFLRLPAPISPLDTRVQNWKNYIFFFLLFFSIYTCIDNKKDAKRLLSLMCLAILLNDYYVIKQISWITAWWNRFKISGTFAFLGVNEVASFFATYNFVLIGLVCFIKNKFQKLILRIIVILNLYCILFMYSRAAYLATLAGFLIISILRCRWLLIFLIVFVLSWQTLVPLSVKQRIEFTETEGQLDQSAQKRIQIWNECLWLFGQNPILGTGYNTFIKLGYKMDAHNIYVRTLVEQGILGLFFLLLTLVLAFKRSWRLFRISKDELWKGLGLGMTTCVVALLISNFFGDRWTPLPLGAFFWVFLGMVERGNIIADKEVKILPLNR